jgi:anti-sigma B factor antagonist
LFQCYNFLRNFILSFKNNLSFGGNMEITTQNFKQCDLVSAHGRVDSATAAELGGALEAITKGGRHKIVLDMSGIEYMSSAGMRVLLATQKECKKMGRGEVVLAAVPDLVKGAFELAGFLPLFAFYDEVTPAVGHF